jgi:hypothetical protein
MLLYLPGTRKKYFYFHSKRYNLTIYVVNFFETFYTCFSSSLGQDPMVESAKSFFKNHLGFLRARNDRCGVFLRKMAKLVL